MKVASRVVAVLLLGMLMLSGTWDSVHAAERPDTVISLNLDAEQPLSGQPDAVAESSSEADEAGFLMPLLTGVCVMVALCCIVLLLSSSSPLRRRRRPFSLTRATATTSPRAGHGRTTVPSLTREQLSLSRT